MAIVDYDTKLLIKKRGYWYYQRRIPKEYAHIDHRKYSKKALRTKAIDEAIAKRDALVKADNEYWSALALEVAQSGGVNDTTLAVQTHRYEAAKARAVSFGVSYVPAPELAAQADPVEIYDRIKLLMKQSGPNTLPRQEDVNAVLGGVAQPNKGKVKVSKAFKLYLDKISYNDQYNKDKDQLYSWKKTKTTSIDYFIDVMGDLDMDSITREQALAYEDWWRNRMKAGKDGKPGVKPNTANRHIGNIRGLYKSFSNILAKKSARIRFEICISQGVQNQQSQRLIMIGLGTAFWFRDYLID